MCKSTIIATACLILLTGCKRAEVAYSEAGAQHGRYNGIGIYTADKLWSKTKDALPAKDDELARLADDDMVIVVTDTQTGEIRQCGNRSGFCITMNPWKSGSAVAPSLPLKLQIHREQLEKADVEAAHSAQ